jgi:ribosomal-protein-serine acetyltransferase
MEQDTRRDSGQLTLHSGPDTELRVVRVEDAEELLPVIHRNAKRLAEWLPWMVPDYAIEDLRRFLRDSADDFAQRRSLTMTIRHRGAVCGAIGLHRIDPRNLSTAIGYWIDEAHEGRGIVTAACRAIITYGFRHMGLHRIEIRCATRNHRSSAVPRRLEFVEEGILREAERVNGQWLDLRVFSMLAADWTG